MIYIYINNSELNRIRHQCEDKVAIVLGIFVDEYLTWTYHMAHVNSNTSILQFPLKQVKHLLPESTFITSCFRSYISIFIMDYLCG